MQSIVTTWQKLLDCFSTVIGKLSESLSVIGSLLNSENKKVVYICMVLYLIALVVLILLLRFGGYGFTYFGYVNERSCSYVVKYITKCAPTDPDFIPEVFVSPGFGRCALSNQSVVSQIFRAFDKLEPMKFRMASGWFASVPKYYIGKLFSDFDRIKRRIALGKVPKRDPKVLFRQSFDVTTRQGSRRYCRLS